MVDRMPLRVQGLSLSSILKLNVSDSLHQITPNGEQGMAQWWERSPPTNVARVQISTSTPYVGWVCCWFSPLLREVFLRVLRFSPLLKNQHFQIPIQPGIRKTKNHFVDVLPLNHYLLFIYLFIYLCVQTLHADYEIFLFQLLLWTFRYHYLHKIPSSTKERE